MENQESSRKHIEGLILILAGSFLYFFGLLKWVPETEDVLYLDLTVFDILQLVLGLLLLIAGIFYYKTFMESCRRFIREHFGHEFSQVQFRIKVMERVVQFVFLVLVHNLTVPNVETIFQEVHYFHHEIILAANILFILLGVFFLFQIWGAVREAVAEAAQSKLLPEEPPADSPVEDPAQTED